jgi:hypothetical protein
LNDKYLKHIVGHSWRSIISSYSKKEITEENHLNKRKETPRQYQEGLFTAISIGFFFLLVGILFVFNPNLFGNVIDFFKDFKLVDVPHTDIILPAPESPQLYLTVYQAARQFSIALGVFQVVILALRFVIPSSWGKRSETVGSFVYWVGASFLIQYFLIDSMQWFVFWSTILILAGVSIIARAVVMAAARI